MFQYSVTGTEFQRNACKLKAIGDTISVEKEFVNGATTTQLAQELAIEGIDHRFDFTTGHTIRYYTSPTTIVYELILDNATYGTLDGTNVLG